MRRKASRILLIIHVIVNICQAINRHGFLLARILGTVLSKQGPLCQPSPLATLILTVAHMGAGADCRRSC